MRRRRTAVLHRHLAHAIDQYRADGSAATFRLWGRKTALRGGDRAATAVQRARAAARDRTTRLDAVAVDPAKSAPGPAQPARAGGTARLVAAAIFAALGLLVGLLLGNPVYLVISLAVGAILGYYAPVAWLKQKVDGRRAEIQKNLPDALDLLVICVDAGLGFDAALARVTDKYKNALSELLAKALREVSLGRPRLEALDEMGRNSGVEDLHNFIQAVIQSEQFGTGIGKILRIQADEMRRKRRQRAQERGAQATLKMMLPMVGCIFPTLWIVLLGPAVLILMQPRG